MILNCFHRIQLDFFKNFKSETVDFLFDGYLLDSSLPSRQLGNPLLVRLLPIHRPSSHLINPQVPSFSNDMYLYR
jgi:hypothetical protein